MEAFRERDEESQQRILTLERENDELRQAKASVPTESSDSTEKQPSIATSPPDVVTDDTSKQENDALRQQHQQALMEVEETKKELEQTQLQFQETQEQVKIYLSQLEDAKIAEKKIEEMEQRNHLLEEELITTREKERESILSATVQSESDRNRQLRKSLEFEETERKLQEELFRQGTERLQLQLQAASAAYRDLEEKMTRSLLEESQKRMKVEKELDRKSLLLKEAVLKHQHSPATHSPNSRIMKEEEQKRRELEVVVSTLRESLKKESLARQELVKGKDSEERAVKRDTQLLSRYKEENATLQQEQVKKTERIKVLEDKLSTLQAALTSHKAKSNAEKDVILKLREQLGTAEKGVTARVEDIKRQKMLLGQKDRKIKELERSLAEVQVTEQDREHKLDEASLSLSGTMDAVLLEQEKLRAENRTLVASMKNLEESNTTLKEDNAKVLESNEALQKHLALMKQDLSEKNQLASKLESIVHQKEAEGVANWEMESELAMQLARAHDETTILLREANTKADEIQSTASKAIHQARNQLAETSRTAQLLQEEKRKLQSDLTGLEEEKRELLSVLEELKGSQAENEELAGKLHQSRQELLSCKQEWLVCVNKLTQVCEDNEALKDCVENLERACEQQGQILGKFEGTETQQERQSILLAERDNALAQLGHWKEVWEEHEGKTRSLVSKLKDDMLEVEERNHAKDEKLSVLIAQLKERTREVEELQSKLRNCSQSLDAANDTMDQMQQAIGALEQDHAQEKEAWQQKNSAAREAEEIAAVQLKQIESLTDKCQRLESQAESDLAAGERAAEAEAELLSTTHELSACRQVVESKRQEIRTLTEELLSARQQAARLDILNFEGKELKEEQEARISKLKDLLDEEKEQHAAVKEEHWKVQQELQGSKAVADSLRILIKELQQEIAVMREELRDAGSVARESKAKATLLQRKLDDLSVDRQKEAENTSTAEQLLKESKDENRLLRKELGMYQLHVRQSTGSQSDEIDRLIRELEIAEARLRMADAEKKIAEKDSSAHQKARFEAESKLREVRREMRKLQKTTYSPSTSTHSPGPSKAPLDKNATPDGQTPTRKSLAEPSSPPL